MELPSQPMLLNIPEQPVPPENRPAAPGQVKFRTANREQTMMATIYVEELIAADHKARAIWQLAGKLDLSGFSAPLRSVEGSAGRPAWDRRLLVSVWVYAYSEGISSAREIERLMQWEPGLQWLCGLEEINHHTLSDFRVEHKAALDELFAGLLAILASAGMVSLEQVMHDGTKIRALAGADTLRREKTLREQLQAAQKLVGQMGDPRAEAPRKDRKQAARERAIRERLERLEAAEKELLALQAKERKAEEKAEVRVSLQEPEARLMKHGNNAIAPSYNAQISTASKNKIIVGAHLSQCSSDAQSLMPAVKEVVGNLGSKPSQMVVDGGFTNRDNIIACAGEHIDLVGSLPDPKQKSDAAMKSHGIAVEFAPSQFRILDNGEGLQCPAGFRLKKLRKNWKRGNLYQQYRARGEDCQACSHQKQCCPRKPERGRIVSIRLEERAEVVSFRKKMEQDEYRAVYKKRGAVAEFPNAWIKDKLGLRKFRVRGLAKAGSELLWACLTYNIMQWIRLVWRQPAMA
jgi:transposase